MYFLTSHKSVVRVPKTVKEAYEIDRKLGTEFWTKAIEKEMTNARISFEKLGGVTPDEMRKGNIKTGYEHVNVHMIFDINMDGRFNRKAILVANSHTKAPPSSVTYSSVVSRDIVGIAFLLAPLNEFYIFAYDIGNSYLNVNRRQKILT